MKIPVTHVVTKSLFGLFPATTFGALLLLSVAHSDASVGINWGTPATISGNTDVLNTGSLLYAYTFGDANVPSATVNGVTFAPFAAASAGSGPVTVGSVTLTLSSDTFGSTNTLAGWSATPFSSLSSSYQGLLQSGVADNIGNPITVTLGGLTIGTTYSVEVWSNDSTGQLTSSNAQASETDGTIVQGITSPTLNARNKNTLGGVGQYVVGTFTAASNSIDFTLTPSVAGAKPELAALEVRFVPEPATIGLLALGGAALLGRHRRSAASGIL